ncbi:hypothetical protein G6F46_011446 [Rhizopus delemar]|uniref:Uncharacterized protein n=3 Tax=Rhizopus TaxID=4842 RepID=I1CFL6_RHIO9|nr:hypothetical protein RO3G_10877 [Rhizopus delemar RA 99-880]KAG1160356.1 hypothetical protein G6F36_014004 [Rhizopus arrhizus]KAG1446937.1 hypothetical protein G6F55_011329 [Rhizopus delemar]EIE87246.1 hypothetical protein RO3G_11957 [Rhizopus delemar RA 99-880]KAG1489784.1 hypothetical protein G6F54_011190 [Rhizopus delemar]|eukprot:EIE86166.1 hypothetical protein RO3G_10877 [Rhizopus delemar RA 99-880]
MESPLDGTSTSARTSNTSNPDSTQLAYGTQVPFGSTAHPTATTYTGFTSNNNKCRHSIQAEDTELDSPSLEYTRK